MILSAVNKCHECEYKAYLGYCEVFDKNACEFHKFDSCANCCHCVEVYDNSEFCYYYCVYNDYRLDSLNQWCGGFSGGNPKLLIERPVIPIAYITAKQIKADMEAMMTPSMDYHIDNEQENKQAMKVKKIIVSTTEHDIDITGATLFTIEEAEKLPEKSREYNRWWWLKSCGLDSYRSILVYTDGFISCYGEYVNYNCVACRPVLTISNLESSGLKIGDVFEFGGKQFEIISNDKAFCLGDIGISVFNYDWKADDANDYEKSDIKKYIDDWFQKSMKENKQ